MLKNRSVWRLKTRAKGKENPNPIANDCCAVNKAVDSFIIVSNNVPVELKGLVNLLKQNMTTTVY